MCQLKVWHHKLKRFYDSESEVTSAADQGALSSVGPDVLQNATSQKWCWPPFKQVIQRDVNNMFYRPPSACLQAQRHSVENGFSHTTFFFSANLSVCKSVVFRKGPGTSVSIGHLYLILLWKLDPRPSAACVVSRKQSKKINKIK